MSKLPKGALPPAIKHTASRLRPARGMADHRMKKGHRGHPRKPGKGSVTLPKVVEGLMK